MIKRLLLFLLIILSVYLSMAIYSLDKTYFFCPISYKRDFIVRVDSRGNGFFAAQRNGRRSHQGIDLLAETGTAVLASRAGKALVVSYNHGMGNYVIIKHPGSLTTVYGHLLNVFVAKNEFVRQGEIIGLAGKTGNASSPDIKPHLHFEVRKNGVPQDPLVYLE